MPVDDIDDYNEDMDEFDDEINGKRRSSRRSRSSRNQRRSGTSESRLRKSARSREQRRRTHRGKNARPAAQARRERAQIKKILGEDITKSREYKEFRRNINDSLKEIADESRKELENSVDNFEDMYKDTIDKSLQLYRQFGNAQNKITKKNLAKNLKVLSESLDEQFDMLEDQFKNSSEYLEDLDKEAHETFLTNRKDDLKDLAKITEKYMVEVGESVDDGLGEGLVDKVKDAFDTITSLDFANALNLGSIADSLKEDAQNLVESANDISVQTGMDPSLVRSIVQQGMSYSMSNLRNKLNQGDILEVVSQMSELGFNTQELYDQYLTPMLNAIVANGSSFDQLSNFLQIDADKEMGGELVEKTTSSINSLIQSHQFNTDSNALTDDMNSIVTSIADLRDASGNPITNEQFMTAMDNQLAGITMLENATYGTERGNLTEAYTGLLSQIATSTDLDQEFAAAFASLGATITDQRTGQVYNIDLPTIRNWMMSDDQYLQSLVPQAIVNAMQAQALSGRGGSQSIYALADIPQLELDESATAALLEQFGTQEQVNQQAEAYNKALSIINGDTQSEMNDYLQNKLPVTIGEQVANGLSNWWDSSPVGSFFTDLFGSLGITITDAITFLALGKNLLFGDNGGLLNGIFGKGGGEVAEKAADDVVEKIAGGTGSGGFLSKIGSFFTKGGGELAEGASSLSSSIDDIAGFASKGAKAGGILAAVTAVVDGFVGMTKTSEWFNGDTSPEATASSFVGAVVGGVGDGLKKGDFWENFLEIGGNALKGAGVGAATGAAVGSAGGPAALIGAAIGAVGGAVTGAIGADTIAGWFKPVVDWASDTGKALADSQLGHLVQDIGRGLADLSSNIWNSTLGPALDWLSEQVQNSAFGRWLSQFSTENKDKAIAEHTTLDDSWSQGKKESVALGDAERMNALRYDSGTKTTASTSQLNQNTKNRQMSQNASQSSNLGLWGAAYDDMTSFTAESGRREAYANQFKNVQAVPTYAGGLSNVPYDNYAAFLHAGEAVLTADQASVLKADGGIDVDGALTSMMTNLIASSNNAVMSNFIYGSESSSGISLYDMVDTLNVNLEKYFSKSLNMGSQQINALGRLSQVSASGAVLNSTNTVAVSKLMNPSTASANTANATSASNAPQNDLAGSKDAQNRNIHVVSSTLQSSRTGQLAQYDVGSRWIPNDQVALLHKGEMVVPADANPVNRPEVASYTDNSDVVEAIRWLGTIITSKVDEVERKIDGAPAPTTPVNPYQAPSMTDIAFSF